MPYRPPSFIDSIDSGHLHERCGRQSIHCRLRERGRPRRLQSVVRVSSEEEERGGGSCRPRVQPFDWFRSRGSYIFIPTTTTGPRPAATTACTCANRSFGWPEHVCLGGGTVASAPPERWKLTSFISPAGTLQLVLHFVPIRRRQEGLLRRLQVPIGPRHLVHVLPVGRALEDLLQEIPDAVVKTDGLGRCICVQLMRGCCDESGWMIVQAAAETRDTLNKRSFIYTLIV